MEGYEIIQSWVRPAYSYVEGDERERYWVDSQNCYYHIVCEETDEKTDKRFDGKKYWIIEPYKPVGVILTEENFKELQPQIKWLVTDTSEEIHEEREWDFDNHCVKTK